MTTWNLISFVPELLCLLFLQRRVPALTYPKDQQPLQEQESEPEPEQEENTHVGSLRKATGITVWVRTNQLFFFLLKRCSSRDGKPTFRKWFYLQVCPMYSCIPPC